MERHCNNALALAKYLKGHDRVEWVNYAALPDDKYHDVCNKITNGQASGIISFGIKGGRDAGAKFIDALQMILRVLSMGDAKSLACHPASTLHRQLTPEQKALAGVSEDLVRISVGIEHIDDIIQDVEQAIKASEK
jgi:O-acetylhomoserine (thiol)-lyase